MALLDKKLYLADLEARLNAFVPANDVRRTLATNLINHGMPIQEVAAVLGHDKIDTTMRYVYIDQRNVETAYRRYA